LNSSFGRQWRAGEKDAGSAVMIKKSQRPAFYHALQRVSVVCIALSATTPSAQAGFLDFLFGRQEAPAAPVYVPAGPTIRHEFRAPVLRRKHVAHQAASQQKTALCCKEGGDPMVAIMNDPTLRRGDAVMTNRGMMVYEGASGETGHQGDDFVALSRAASLSKFDRARISAVSSKPQLDFGRVEKEVSSSSPANISTQQVAGK
jgi:hypothetical protein